MAAIYWIKKLINVLRDVSGKSWIHILNDDGSITSLKVA